MSDKISSKIVANCKLQLATMYATMNSLEYTSFTEKFWYSYIKWIELGRVNEVL